MIFLNVENISKAYSDKKLFENISFGINEGDKIGLIGVNGTGKTTLLKILSGLENEDEGRIIKTNNVNIEYLPQDMDIDGEISILEQVFKGNSANMKVLRDYQKAIYDETSSKDLIIELTEEMDRINCWDLESDAKNILTKLGITDFQKKMNKLSGGEKKRVMLASALINKSELLILDEPTNHLDNDTIDWLEEFLKNRKGALMMITHDRYFLDKVTNKILELEGGDLYSYEGNYSYYLEKKMEREDSILASERKRQSIYRKELAWIKRGAKARSTKQKARIDRFNELENSELNLNKEEVNMDFGTSRLGKKIIEIKNITKFFGDFKVIDNFTYTVLRDDRVGILGKNGMGKSTLFKLILGQLPLDKGSIEIGETVNIGFFSQGGEDLDLGKRAIEYIKEAGEYVTTKDGTKISAAQMMETFLFSKELQWTPISKLSGGEKRRLHLLRVLMKEPNVLLLDEPTNDLDIQTLTILEEYIENFKGAVIIISHDRYLLDKLVDKVFVYEGNGQIKEYTGNYSYFKESRLADKNSKGLTRKEKEVKSPKEKREKPLKLTYSEKIEWEKISGEIEALENKLIEIEKKMERNARDYSKLEELIVEKDELENNLEKQMDRWFYLSEKVEKIEKQGK